MKQFGEFIVAKRWWVLAFWLVAAVAIVALSPSLSSVESTDQSSFLPKSYESIKAMDTAKQVSPQSQDASDIIVFKRTAGGELSSADSRAVQTIVSQLNARHLGNVAMVVSSAQQLSPDHRLQLATVLYDGNSNNAAVVNAVKDVRSAVHSLTSGTSLTANVTGQVAIGYDSQGASEKALKIVGIGTLLLVLVLPALIFRSPLAGLLPVVAVGIVSFIANALIADAATWFHFKVNQQLSVIFTVVLFGIGTDYILFLLFRYRERLRSGEHGREAVSFALARAGEAILSAALVVLTSFTALFFAKFGIFSSMAPGLVICVAIMMLAALTLVPALVAIVGTKVFWPSKAWQSQSLNPSISKRVGGLVAARPALVTVVVTALLVGLSIFALGYKADFSSFSKPPQGTESAAGYNDLLAAFPAGVTNPAQVFVTSTQSLTNASLQPLVHALSTAKGVAIVLPATIAPSGRAAMLSVILKDDPYSSTAIGNVSGPIRAAAHTANSDATQVYVGGVTSVFADIQDVTARDLRVLFPIAAMFIFLILAILLRSLVAPIFLLVTVGLGYMATLGATTLIFERIGHAPGLIFFIPLFMYLFVVAIGTDYNILTMTRLREEIRERRKPRPDGGTQQRHGSVCRADPGSHLRVVTTSRHGRTVADGFGCGHWRDAGGICDCTIPDPQRIGSARLYYMVARPSPRQQKIATATNRGLTNG